jgi:hypothetical protein
MKKYITKQSSIKGAGKGLFTKDFFKKGEVIGLAHVDDQPASEIGRNHNHNEKNPTAYSKKINNKRFIYASRNLKPGEEITTNYRMQPELEQPEDFMRKGGALLTKKVTCKSCGWEWDAEDGGKDITTCHKCGGQGLIHAQKGGESKCLNGQVWSKKDKKCIDLPVFGNSLNSGTFTKSTNLSDGFKIKPLNSFSDFGKIKPKKIPVIKDNFLETLEKDINDFLDNPKAKAAQLSESLADKDEVASDALRHSTAGALAAQTIANKTGNIPFISNPLGYLGANIAGIGHELSTLSQAYLDDRPWSVKLQESLEDIYNNSVGANTIFNNNSEKDKINYLLKLTRTNQLPDGYGEERPFRHNPKWTDPYNQKQYGGNTDAMNGMMKARLAYANEFGNPAAERMINLPDNPYQFDNGDTGSHYMASMDNYAVPQIQDENGVLVLGDYGPESNEAIRFDSDEDANYFAENYKDISPGFIEADLDEDEIEEYRRGGYIVEEIDTYQKGGTVYTVKGSKGYYKKVNGQWQVDWNRSGKYQPLSKGDVKARTAVLDKMAKPVDNGISKVLSNSSDNTRVNYQKPLVESFNRSNNLESFYKKEREKDLQKQKDATAYHDKTQKVKQNQSFGEFLNQDVLGIPTYEEQIDQVTNDKKLLKKELKPYFETEKELDQFVNQQYSRPTASTENNWNDGPIQLVYPEKYGIGPGGGMIGNIKNLGINTFNLGKKVLSNPYVSGGLNAYFGYHGINEFNDPNSHTRKSTNRAWNNPTPTNVKHALYDNSINLLNFVGLPFGKTINGSKTLIKELKQLPSSSIKKLSSILYKPKTNSLQIKSTMVGSPLEKQLSKSGEININSIKAHIGKSDVSLQDKFIINKILNEQFAGKIKINYNDFKKAVSKQLVPLERSFDDRYNDYGLKRLGFGEGDKRRINVDILLTKSQINILEKYKKNIPLYLKDHGWKHQIPTIDGKFTYPKNSELKNEIQKLLNDKKFELENFKKDLLLTGGDKVIKNSSIVYGNKNMFGIGSTQHFENEGALGHSRIFVSKNEPKIMHVLEQQSDYYQNNNILKEQLNLKLDYEYLINKQKMLLEEEKILNEYKYKYKNNINDKNGDKINKSQLDQIEENLLKKKHNIELRLNNLKNPEQKQFLGKYQQERLLQENVAYAAEQGKTKMRYPTPETASKIQGYVQRIQTGDNAPEFAKLQEEISIATRQGDQEKVNELMKVHDEILNTPYKSYHPEHQTILKKYLDQPKMIKKIFKQDVKIITDNKGNTWYEFDIPEKFKKGNAEIRAFSNGGENNNYIDINLTPEEIQKYKDGGYVVEELPEMQSGGSPSQVWYQYTGTPWSEARKKGLTDGSKEQNIKLRKKILAGEFGKPKFSNEKYQNIESNYDRNIEKMVAQGKTLDQLVKQKVGTRVGLKSRFPELFKTKSKLDDFLPKKNNSTSSKTQNKITTPVKNRWGNVTVESNNGKPIYRKDDYIDMVQSKNSKTKAEGLKMQAEHKKQLQAEKIKKQKKDLLNVEALLANAANTHKAQVKAIEAARVAKLSEEEKAYEYFLGKPAPAKVEPIKVEPIPGSMASQIKGDHNKKYYDDNGIEIKPILWDPDTSLWDMNKGLLEQKWFPFSEKLIESQKYKPEGFFKMFPDPSTKEAQAYLKAEQAKENAKKEEEDFQYREAMIKENPETSIEEIDQFIQDQKSIAYENSIAGPHNNYNDGPVQMVYPERVFAYGPSGGILGGLLRNPYVMGAGNLYFGAQGISEWADSDSDLRKSISKAWDDPTWSNIGDFSYELGANALNYIGLPFSKYYKNSRNVTKIPIPKKYGPFKPRKPKTINLNQNPRWLQLPKYNSKGYLEYKKYQDGGNVSKLGKQKIDNYKLDKEIVSDLSKEEINKLVSQGYIVEQIN